MFYPFGRATKAKILKFRAIKLAIGGDFDSKILGGCI